MVHYTIYSLIVTDDDYGHSITDRTLVGYLDMNTDVSNKDVFDALTQMGIIKTPKTNVKIIQLKITDVRKRMIFIYDAVNFKPIYQLQLT